MGGGRGSEGNGERRVNEERGEGREESEKEENGRGMGEW